MKESKVQKQMGYYFRYLLAVQIRKRESSYREKVSRYFCQEKQVIKTSA